MTGTVNWPLPLGDPTVPVTNIEPLYVTVPESVGLGIVKPDGRVVDSEGVPEPLVTSVSMLVTT